jgi:alcohol dehydrogenase (NADP+)
LASISRDATGGHCVQEKSPYLPEPALPVQTLSVSQASLPGTCAPSQNSQSDQEQACESGRLYIYLDVEVIPVTAIDEAYQRVLRGQLKFCFVIDMKT